VVSGADIPRSISKHANSYSRFERGFTDSNACRAWASVGAHAVTAGWPEGASRGIEENPMRGGWHVVGGSVVALSLGLVSQSAVAQCATSVVGFGAGEPGETSFVFDLGQSTTPALDTEVVQISGGVFHTAAVLADGTVVCWGSNAFSWPSGLGRVFGTDASGAPIAIGTIGQRVQYFGKTLTGIAEVSGGELHTAARRVNGSVIAWGDNIYGQLNVPEGLVATKIDAGSLHTLALTPSGGVVCWGACAGVPTGAASGMTDLAAGYEHSLAWNAAGNLYAWGRNDFGQSTVPTALPATKQAAGGAYSTIALGFDGVVRAWGGNQGGQCGGTNADGSIDTSGGTQLRVVRILGQPLDNVVAVSSGGGYHGMALRADGSVAAWGAGNYFNWAQGQATVPPSTAGRAVAIDAGYVHSYIQVTTSTADCDANGMVDCVEIALGQASDSDGDGELDVCESTVFVPAQYPTIQAAIDAVPEGAARTVLVAPGTYNQSFSLNGKNIVVRGAPKGGTVLDGTGLTTSIARFSGGEPATAGLEDLVFRNGTAGSLIYPKAPFRVGGAVFGIYSSAFIHNCRFEDNRSNFGGAVYFFQCRMDVRDCVFDQNLGLDEAGALFAYETSGAVVDCVFTENDCAPFATGAASAFKAVGALVAGETVLLNGCTITGGDGGVSGAAVEFFENTAARPGVLRIVGTQISGNIGGAAGAGGLKVIGTQDSCVLTGGTSICSNLPRNVTGPFLIEGSATVCDCLADLTLDNAVNGADLGVVLAAWGAASSNGAGDANRDGFVNGADLAQILAAWGACQ
jgi:alpha-tubulin suppressor-like RCC1 family protein